MPCGMRGFVMALSKPCMTMAATPILRHGFTSLRAALSMKTSWVVTYGPGGDAGCKIANMPYLETSGMREQPEVECC